MDISFWKIFAIFGVVSRWAEKALADGKVTLTEALELVLGLAEILGVSTLFELPNPTKAMDKVSDIVETEDDREITHVFDRHVLNDPD